MECGHWEGIGLCIICKIKCMNMHEYLKILHKIKIIVDNYAESGIIRH